MLVNFDGLTLLINWIRWSNLKYKKERNYRSDLIYHSKYRLLSFELIRKTCEGLNCKLTSVICDEEGRGYVSNTKTQLDCKYLCADQFEHSTFPPFTLLRPLPLCRSFCDRRTFWILELWVRSVTNWLKKRYPTKSIGWNESPHYTSHEVFCTSISLVTAHLHWSSLYFNIISRSN